MKKTLLCICSLIVSSMLFAELYKPNRIVEVGVDGFVGVSNGYFSLEEMLVKDIKLDLQEIADGISDDGLGIDFQTNDKAFINFNFGDAFRLGSFFQVEGSGYALLDHDIFQAVSDGVKVGSKLDFDINAVADVFAVCGVSYQTKIKDYRIKVIPAYVIPLIYLKDASAEITYESTSDGAVKANVKAPLELYTVVDPQKYVDNEFETADISVDLADALRRGGFDLSLEVERPLLNTFEAGVYSRIPLVPGRLNYSMKKTFTASVEIENVLDYIQSSDDDEEDEIWDKNTETTYGSASAKVFRPFRLGVEGAWRPFGKYVTFRPKLGFAVRNPYSSSMQFYGEYGLDADVTFFNIIGVSAGTGYENRTFSHRFGVMLNFRLVELIVKAQLRGTDFVNSFSSTGLGAYAGVRVGF